MNIDAAQEKRDFSRILLTLAVPIVIQNLIDAAVNAADVVMLGYVGQTALSASSLANKVYFVLSLFFFGISTGSSVLIAQYWGKKDTHTIERVMGITLRITLIISVLFALASWLIPEKLMLLFNDEADVVAAGSDYLRVVALSYLCVGFSSIYAGFMRAIERVRFSMMLTMVQLGINVVLNACFIFGLLGLPKLGIVGVALATTISRLVGMAICLIDTIRSKLVKVRLPLLFARTGDLARDFIRFTLPALGNDVAWGLGFSMYSVILGHMGSDCVAADAIAGTVRNLATVICFALANAAAILLGKTMGENRLDDALVYAKRITRIVLIVSIIGAVLILVTSPLVSSYAQLTETARDYLRFMLLVSSYNIIGQALNTLFVCGFFRAGGDTKFGFYMDLIIMWGYGVLVGAVLAFVVNAPVMLVYFAMFFDEIVKLPIVIRHYKKRVWLQNITRDLSRQ